MIARAIRLKSIDLFFIDFLLKKPIRKKGNIFFEILKYYTVKRQNIMEIIFLSTRIISFLDFLTEYYEVLKSRITQF